MVHDRDQPLLEGVWCLAPPHGCVNEVLNLSSAGHWTCWSLLVWNLRSFGVESETGPRTQTARRDGRKGSPSRLGGGRFRKKGAYIRGLGTERPGDLCTRLPARILKAYAEALMGFSPILSPDGVNIMFSLRAASLKMVPMVGTLWGCTFQGWGRGEEPLFSWVQLKGHPVITPSQWPHPTPLLHL